VRVRFRRRRRQRAGGQGGGADPQRGSVEIEGGRAAERGPLSTSALPVRTKITISTGRHIHTGTALTDDTIAGWCATDVEQDGTLGLRGTVRGEPDPVYARLTPDALLRNNPRMLNGHLVRHPAPPRGLDAADWVVDAVGWHPDDVAGEEATLVLVRDQVRSTARVDDLVRVNLDDLRTRIEVVHDS
jgi:hypothetical protein